MGGEKPMLDYESRRPKPRRRVVGRKVEYALALVGAILSTLVLLGVFGFLLAGCLHVGCMHRAP